MGKYTCLLGLKQFVLLGLVFFSWQCGVFGNQNDISREMEIERKLKQLNKPAVKTIQSEDGDIIDCVDIYKQPAFDHPLLKNHTIQWSPKVEGGLEIKENSSKSTFNGFQTWQKSGSCPKGTVPIRRVKREDLMRATSLDAFGKMPWSPIVQKEFKSENGSVMGNVGFHSNNTVATLITVGFSYRAARAMINVWNPIVEADDEYSSAQLWLTKGSQDDYDSVQGGWMVNPSLFGDRKTRLFVYWTRDGGKTTGCFNMVCEGFVQVSTEVVVGAELTPISSSGGPQSYLDLYIFQDLNKNWWVMFGGGIYVGYWPGKLFDDLTNAAHVVLFGGNVYSPRAWSVPHTGTGMGSGHIVQQRLGYAAFIEKPRIQDNSAELKYPPYPAVYSPQPYCYNAENFAASKLAEPIFYYGGPGRGLGCP